MDVRGPGGQAGFRRAGRGIEAGLVTAPGADGFGHRAVDFQNHPLRAVLAVFLFVLALGDGEGLQDVLHCFPLRGEIIPQLGAALFLPVIGIAEIQRETSGVQLASDHKAALFIPNKRGAVVAAIPGEGLQVPGGED